MDKERKDYLLSKIIDGVIVGFLWSIFISNMKPDKFFEFGGFSWRRFLQYLFVAMIVFPIGGYLTGLWHRRWTKRK